MKLLPFDPQESVISKTDQGLLCAFARIVCSRLASFRWCRIHRIQQNPLRILAHRGVPVSGPLDIIRLKNEHDVFQTLCVSGGFAAAPHPLHWYSTPL